MNHLSPYIFTRTARPDLPFSGCRYMGQPFKLEAVWMHQGFEIDGTYYQGGQFLLYEKGKLKTVSESDFNTHYVWI